MAFNYTNQKFEKCCGRCSHKDYAGHSVCGLTGEPVDLRSGICDRFKGRMLSNQKGREERADD